MNGWLAFIVIVGASPRNAGKRGFGTYCGSRLRKLAFHCNGRAAGRPISRHEFSNRRKVSAEFNPSDLVLCGQAREKANFSVFLKCLLFYFDWLHVTANTLHGRLDDDIA